MLRPEVIFLIPSSHSIHCSHMFTYDFLLSLSAAKKKINMKIISIRWFHLIPIRFIRPSVSAFGLSVYF